MIRVGITGQQGFVGQHLFNTLGLFPKEFERVNFTREFFDNEPLLSNFIKSCDVIVHLAAMNRHRDPEVIYETNINLVKKLVKALDASSYKPHVIFSSTSQEDRDNHYGRSKSKCREVLTDWATRSCAKFTGLIIPNVFGPFGKPFYNSFIATFCHQLTHKEHVKIDVDSSVKLIYISDLVTHIIDEIRNGSGNDFLKIPHQYEYKVSEILQILNSFKLQYFQQGLVPALSSSFELNLFNTFRSYIDIKNHFPIKVTKHSDTRGAFVEIIRLDTGGQVSFSVTNPEVTRGNHYHTRKIERFAVIKGNAQIQLRRIDTPEVIDYYLSGDEPAYVDMPIWYTHNIKNIGSDELFTIFWINEFYNSEDPDTYFELV
jgi:UDP-2-acetamido-2,6-beta-L-arabino-hexul-4-ose reductase